MKLYEEVKSAGSIGISGHIRPDGDCIGACMGLYLYLKKLCPDAAIEVFLEQPAEVFSCIKGMEEIHTDFKTEIPCFDVFLHWMHQRIDWERQKSILTLQKEDQH